MIHFHRWSMWTVAQHYIDTSWGFDVPSTTMIRQCRKSGIVKSRDLYAVTVPCGGVADE